MTNKFFRTLKITCFCMALTTAIPLVSLADQPAKIKTDDSYAVKVIRLDENGNPLEEAKAEEESLEETDTEAVKDKDSEKAQAEETKDSEKENEKEKSEAETEKSEEEKEETEAEDKDEDAEDEEEAEDADEEAEADEDAEESEDEADDLRSEIVEYALQFVGNRYKYGGTDPNKGVDCSGFTAYVMRHAAGVELPHSSRSQSGMGKTITSSQMRPGDLLFYGSKKHINHVAMYIGDGKIVHASNAKSGIKVSRWNYRTPVKIVNVLGD